MDAKNIALFVVLTILGTIASSHLALLNSERSKERDARRLSDIAQIQSALKSYYKEHKMYPAHTDVVTSLVNDIQSSLVPTYVPSIPQDPLLRNGDPEYGYRYCADNNTGQNYSLLVYMENPHPLYVDKGCTFSTGMVDCGGFNNYPPCSCFPAQN
jgi:type II secretory pathway pseudopilin PulG